jgi:hypothetical protein
MAMSSHRSLPQDESADRVPALSSGLKSDETKVENATSDGVQLNWHWY